MKPLEKLDHTSSVPLHVQAETALRRLISSGEYGGGKLLPREVELAARLNISRNTLRQAINRLVFEGVLVRRRGYGTVVAPQVVLSNARNWMSFSQEMRAQGFEVGNFELHVAWKLPPSARVGDFFRIPADVRLLCMERLRGKADEPFVYFVSYFSPAIGLTGEENFSLPLYDMLEQRFGIVVQTSKEQISAEGASEPIAAKLGVGTGDPVLVRRRLVYDAADRPVEYNVGYYKSDSFTYSIEFRRD